MSEGDAGECIELRPRRRCELHRGQAPTAESAER